MADQKRWWKLWCSAPGDDDVQALPPAIRWAWAAFGAYTKLHGTKGQVVVKASNNVLAAEMGVPLEALFDTIKMLPHMTVEESKNRHGEITVTWHNWVKYQEDSTQADRARASRSKRRGEEKRGEENLKDKASPVDNSEKEKKELWQLVGDVKATDPTRFVRLNDWAGRALKDAYPPGVVKLALEKFVEREKKLGRVDEYWKFLTDLLKRSFAEVNQAESARYKKGGAESLGEIMGRVMPKQ